MSTFNANVPREPKRVPMACTHCRQKKLKCRVDQGQTRCQRCVHEGVSCRFVPVSLETSSSNDWSGSPPLTLSANGTPYYYDQSSTSPVYANQPWPARSPGDASSSPVMSQHAGGGSYYQQGSYVDFDGPLQYSGQGTQPQPAGHLAANPAYNPYSQSFNGTMDEQQITNGFSNPAMQYPGPHGYVNPAQGSPYQSNPYSPYAQSPMGTSRDGNYPASQYRSHYGGSS